VWQVTLLELFKEYLIDSGVEADRIISITFTHGSDEVMSVADVLKEVRGKIVKGMMNYVFLDEIQMVESWEKAVLTIFEEGYSDLYISGSNSKMFFSNLSTLISGRAAEVGCFLYRTGSCFSPAGYSIYLGFVQEVLSPQIVQKNRRFWYFG